MVSVTPKFVAVTRVMAGREQEFESLMPVIGAAQAHARPHLTGRWQILRPDASYSDADAPVYLFLFYGDGPLDDWKLNTLFIDTHGEEEGRRLYERFYRCLDGEQDIYAFSGEVTTS